MKRSLSIAIALLLLELIAYLGLESVPLDIGYPDGTSLWRIAFGAVGLCVHYPILLVLSPGYFDGWPRNVLKIVIVLVGYADLWLLVLAFVFARRIVRRFSSARDSQG